MFKPHIIATVFILSIPCFNTKAQERFNQELYNNKKVPIVYLDRYNINFFGIEKFYFGNSFGPQKVFERIKNYFEWDDDKFLRPEKATHDYLKTFHSSEYIDSLNQSWKELALRAAGFFLFCAWPVARQKLTRAKIKIPETNHPRVVLKNLSPKKN